MVLSFEPLSRNVFLGLAYLELGNHPKSEQVCDGAGG